MKYFRRQVKKVIANFEFETEKSSNVYGKIFVFIIVRISILISKTESGISDNI